MTNPTQKAGSVGSVEALLDNCEKIAMESGAHESYGKCRDAFAALRAALAGAAETEPVMTIGFDESEKCRSLPFGMKLYAHPPAPALADGVTDEEVESAATGVFYYYKKEMRRALENFAASRTVAAGALPAKRSQTEIDALKEKGEMSAFLQNLTKTRGYVCLREFILQLRENGEAADDEGEDTDALEELADAILAATPSPAPAPLGGGEETVPAADYEGVMRILAEQRAKNSALAALILDNDRAGAVKWASGITTDGSAIWPDAAPLQAQDAKDAILATVRQIAVTSQDIGYYSDGSEYQTSAIAKRDEGFARLEELLATSGKAPAVSGGEQ